MFHCASTMKKQKCTYDDNWYMELSKNLTVLNIFTYLRLQMNVLALL